MKFLKQFSVALALLVFCAAICVMFFILPREDYSENEKRVLSEFPEITLETLKSGKLGDDIETWLSDHMPMREFFVGVDAYAKLVSGRNGEDGIYACRDGYLIAAPYEYNAEQTRKNAAFMDSFAKDTGLPAKLILVPAAGYVMSDYLPALHGEYMDDDLFRDVSDALESVDLVDLREALKKNASLGVYYRTDHHLTSAGAAVAYNEYCAALGITPADFKVTETKEGFYGTGYSKSGLWLTKPDTVEIREPEKRGDFSVTITEAGEKKTGDSLFFREHYENEDKYPVFLDGNHSVVTVENKNGNTGRRLLIVKDSYAHCFATLEAYDCDEICMVDLRYYKGSVYSLIEEYGLNEILFVYGTENLNSMTDFGWLKIK